MLCFIVFLSSLVLVPFCFHYNRLMFSWQRLVFYLYTSFSCILFVWGTCFLPLTLVHLTPHLGQRTEEQRDAVSCPGHVSAGTGSQARQPLCILYVCRCSIPFDFCPFSSILLGIKNPKTTTKQNNPVWNVQTSITVSVSQTFAWDSSACKGFTVGLPYLWGPCIMVAVMESRS